MNGPTMFDPIRTTDDTTVLPSWMPIPGLGVLAVNAFLIEADEPVLIDTGLAAVSGDFMKTLRQAIDPDRLRWIWMTHVDPDHTGSLRAVLDAAPRARVVTTFVGMAKMGLVGLPTDRVYLLNPGQSLDVGDRKLLAVKPPTFDAPETTALFDEKTRTLFSADSFGAVLDEPAEAAETVGAERLRDGMTLWATVDAPWLNVVEEAGFRRVLNGLQKLDATRLLSSHLPAATRMDPFVETLVAAREATPFVGPDQAALEAMMAGLAQAS